MRYDQLLDLIDESRPRTIIEVGVARAERACAMCLRALRYRSDVHYIGYDVFETMDAAFHAAAYNLKQVLSRSACAERLAAIQKQHEGFTFSLVTGDTRDTLHHKPVVADLVFIDGDHRIDAIHGDYQALRGSSIVVLDDYYVSDERGCPDIEFVGCNRLVDNMNGRAVLLPDSDAVRDGGRVQMAVVRCSGAV
jgi:hypothetical protein